MRTTLVLVTLQAAIGFGIAILRPEWSVWVLVLAALLLLVMKWRERDAPPIDPVFLADVDEMMKLEKSDPAAAEKLLGRALDDSSRREERHLAVLRQHATGGDGRAALQLRNVLRHKLKTERAARLRAEKLTLDSPNRGALLKEMDRAANEIQQQLVEAEELLTRTGGYGWSVQVMEFLRPSRPY